MNLLRGINFKTSHTVQNLKAGIKVFSRQNIFTRNIYFFKGPFEYGERGSQGKRNDLKTAWQAVKDGKSDADIAASEETGVAYVKFYRGLNAVRLALSKQRTHKTVVYWLYGLSHSGKTHFAMHFDPNTYVKPAGSKWFDGYQGQTTVLMDEFDHSWLSLNQLLRLLDNTPLVVETKGGHVPFVAKTIFITSNSEPLNFYRKAHEKDDEKRYALCRRIEHVWHYDKRFDPNRNDNTPPAKMTGLEYLASWRVRQRNNWSRPDSLGYVSPTDDSDEEPLTKRTKL